MKREEFVKAVADLVQRYMDNFDMFDSNPQLRVNPVTLDMTIVNGSDLLDEIEDSNEAVEDAAASQGAATDDATDYQVKQNPDFYPVRSLMSPHPAPGFHPTISPAPDLRAIEKVAAHYAAAFVA